MKQYNLDSIFVPGGIPSLTYVPREEFALEEQLRSATKVNKLTTVTGATKSGKTVLVCRLFPRQEAIWIDGGHIRTEDDFWNFVLAKIDGFTSKKSGTSATNEDSLGGEIVAQGLLPFLGSIKAKITSMKSVNRSKSKESTLQLPAKIAAITQIEKKRIPIVIDDFHYIERQLQGILLRSIKPLILDGHHIILIAIPHRRYDAIKVEREFVGRLECIEIPPWNNTELVTIPKLGFKLLNINISESVTEKFANEALGSPHLMQEFCRILAQDLQVTSTLAKQININAIDDQIYKRIAAETGRVVYEKLCKGPTERSKRLQRPLVSGGTADTYELTLLALTKLQPGMSTIPYPKLVETARSLLCDKLPETNEITRVLEKMSEIAYSDDSSVPVLDFEKDDRVVHITDPFFAFFLKWGEGNSQNGRI